MRNLVHAEAGHEITPRNAKMEEVMRNQIEVEEELGRKMDYEKATWIPDERAQRFEQFMIS